MSDRRNLIVLGDVGLPLLPLLLAYSAGLGSLAILASMCAGLVPWNVWAYHAERARLLERRALAAGA